MSEAQNGNAKPYDPLEPFRGMRDAYLDAMAKTMVEVVNTDAYAQASGALLDSTLTMSAPFREALEKSMLQVLQQLSLPSRQDILGLAERFTNIEMRLDDMDACVTGYETKLQASMLPILQQLLLLTERITKLNARLDLANSKPSPVQATADSGQSEAKATTPKAVGAKLRPRSKAPVAAKASPAKRNAGKGAR